MNSKKGYAAIVIVFIVGLVSLFLSLSLLNSGFIQSLNGRSMVDSDRAFFAAQSGIEEAFSRLTQNFNYGLPGPATASLTVGSGLVEVDVYGTGTERTIQSIASVGRNVKRIRSVVQYTSLSPGFLYAVHAGGSGFELGKNSMVAGKNGSIGNVYSNSYILGGSNSHNNDGTCKNDSSQINGSAWAVQQLDKGTASNADGVCVTASASASSFNYCYISGDGYLPSEPNPTPSPPPASSCDLKGSWKYAPAPTPIPLPDMGISQFKNYLSSKGDKYPGDCEIGGVSDCSTQKNSLPTIGNLIIEGSLTIAPSTSMLMVDGPVWVKGNVIFKSGMEVNLAPNITEISQLFVADGFIDSPSNVTFGSNGTAFLLFISTLENLCSDTPPAITISSNSQSVLFYATVGCVFVNTTGSGSFTGAILGEQIATDVNVKIYYDPALATAIFGLTKSGGWQTKTFTQF